MHPNMADPDGRREIKYMATVCPISGWKMLQATFPPYYRSARGGRPLLIEVRSALGIAWRAGLKPKGAAARIINRCGHLRNLLLFPIGLIPSSALGTVRVRYPQCAINRICRAARQTGSNDRENNEYPHLALEDSTAHFEHCRPQDQKKALQLVIAPNNSFTRIQQFQIV